MILVEVQFLEVLQNKVLALQAPRYLFYSFISVMDHVLDYFHVQLACSDLEFCLCTFP